MRKSTVVGTLAAIFISGCGPAIVEYDGHSGAMTSPRAIRSGTQLEVHVNNLNHLCYSYEVKLDQVIVHDSAISFGDLMPEKPGVAPKPASPRDSSLDVSPTPLWSFREDLRSGLERLEALKSRADIELEEFRALACPTSGGKGVSMTQLESHWAASTGPAIEAFLAELKKHSDMDLAAAPSGALGKSSSSFSAGEVAVWRASRLRNSLPSMDSAAAGYGRYRSVVGDAIAIKNHTILLRVGPNTDTIKLAVTAQRTASKDAAPVAVTNLLPVNRWVRFFLSSGFLYTSMPAHDYARVNRVMQVPTSETDPSLRDSVYSTFGDRAPGKLSAFSPVLLANASVTPWQYADLAVTSGVAMRSVAGNVAPEYVLGVSATLRDRFVATAGMHIGRTEKFLLGNVSEIEKRPVPSTVTLDDAVGIRWRRAFAFLFSYRL